LIIGRELEAAVRIIAATQAFETWKFRLDWETRR
jgi:hypothetical protein